MFRKKLIVNLTIVFGLSTYIIPTVEAAPNNQEIREQRSEIQEEIELADQQINEAKAETIELDEKIKRTDEAIEKNEATIENTVEDIADAEAEIEQINKKIDDLEETIEERNKILKQRAVSLQRNGGSISYFEVIMGSSSFSDFIDRVVLVTKMAEADSNIIEQHQADTEELENSKTVAMNKLENLRANKVELEGMTAQIEAQREHNEQLKQELEAKLADNHQLKAVLEQRERNLAWEQNQSVQTNDSQQEIVQLSAEKPKNSTKDTKSKSISNQGNPSDTIQTAIKAGYPHIGTPYVWAGKTPRGFDCSGFISWAFGQAGVSLPSSTASLQYSGERVSVNEMKPGDIVFFDTYKKNGHAGIYIGGNKFIGSQNSTGLDIADMSKGYWKSHFNGHVRRVVN